MPIKSRGESKHVTRELKVLNRLGLHARPAAEFVKCAQSFHSTIRLVTEDGATLDGARIMDVLLANLGCGSAFVLHAEGTDADKAVARIERLLSDLKDFDDLPLSASGSSRKERPD